MIFMPPLLPQLLLSTLLLCCLASFGWAVQKFFVRPEQITPGLRMTLLAGVIFAALHFAVIFQTLVWSEAAVMAAAILYCAALSIFWWTISANRAKPLSACFSRNEELHLVQDGPYRFVRHPFYCSYLLTWLAGAVGTLNFWLGVTFLIMFVLYLTAARQEESKFATGPLAEAYARYRRSTGRFLPSPFKLIISRHSR